MNLNGQWKLYFYENGTKSVEHPCDLAKESVDHICATVPGNVELDLSTAGILPQDLYMGENIKEAERFELYDWWYETTFVPQVPPNDEKVFLKFGGVDCVADYFLNGEHIGFSNNMFIEQRFDITHLAKFGMKNSLFVHITSPIVYADQQRIDPFELVYSWNTSAISQTIRKAPHSYGWDIMPRAVSAGIWRDVQLEYIPRYGFDYTYFSLHYLRDMDAAAEMVFKLRLPKEEIFTEKTLHIYGKCENKTIDFKTKIYSTAGKVIFPIDYDTLWWPKNYGKPCIYHLSVEIFAANGKLLAKDDFRQGFRSVQLLHSDVVEPNGKFEIQINNTKILAIGSNWVPMDAYHSRDRQRYQKAVGLAIDCGCNILRCWGGNVYEDHEFFELCDENGIMVWQDFAMACMNYPQNTQFLRQIEEEVTAVVEKLRNHPSLILWCGDNEVDTTMIGFKTLPNAPKPSVNRITRELLPRLLLRLDPKRPYLPSSPFISDNAYDMGGEYYPEDHLWGPRDYFKSEYYKRSKAYFVSETGYHGCPCQVSIRKFISPEKVWPYFDNAQWILHSSDQKKDPFRVMLMHGQVEQLFGEAPTQMDDYILASQISQAEAKKFFIERVRANANRMGGVIWWNLIDGWPQMSDAVVDYYYEKKLAYNYIQRSSRPVIAMIGEMADWGHPVLLSNCSDHKAEVTVRVYDADTNRDAFTGSGIVGRNSVMNIGKIPMKYSEKGMLIIAYTVDEVPYINTYLYGTPKYDYLQYKNWLKKIEEAEKRL